MKYYQFFNELETEVFPKSYKIISSTQIQNLENGEIYSKIPCVEVAREKQIVCKCLFCKEGDVVVYHTTILTRQGDKKKVTQAYGECDLCGAV